MGWLTRFRWARSMPLEHRLRVLADHGISLNPGRTVDELLRSWSRAEFESGPHSLLVSLGGEVEDGDTAGSRFSNSIWHFDTECIDDQGAYVGIANRIRDLAGGALPIERVQDSVDIDAGEAWVSFSLAGTTHRWEAEIDNDWVDPKILSRFASLLEGQKSGKRLSYLNLGGQDCLIGCATEAQLKGLRNDTGLRWMWLS